MVLAARHASGVVDGLVRPDVARPYGTAPRTVEGTAHPMTFAVARRGEGSHQYVAAAIPKAAPNAVIAMVAPAPTDTDPSKG